MPPEPPSSRVKGHCPPASGERGKDPGFQGLDDLGLGSDSAHSRNWASSGEPTFTESFLALVMLKDVKLRDFWRPSPSH